MTGASKKGDGTVGYKRPPAAHRFKPGVSGNPKGRQRKRPPESTWANLGPDDVLLASLAREVKGTENGRPTTLSYFEIISRRMLEKAAQGDGPAGRTVMNIALAEARRASQARAEMMTNALEAQLTLENHLNWWVAAGNNEMSIDLHPRDIEINWSTGEVRCYLSFTQEQLEIRAQLCRRLDEAMAKIQVTLALIAEDGDDELLALVRDLARHEIENLNASLPSRFRCECPDESPLGVAKAPLAVTVEIQSRAKRWTERMMPQLRGFLGIETSHP